VETLLQIMLETAAEVVCDLLVAIATHSKKKKQEDLSPNNYITTPEA
jgi:hypothetical protein